MDSASDLTSLSSQSLRYSNKSVTYEDKKFNAYSNIDLEIQIQNERIVSIFNETISKTEAVIFLLHLNDDSISLMQNNISQSDINFIKEFCNLKMNYENLEYNDYIPITDDEIQQMFIDPGTKVLPELSHAIWILLSNQKMKTIIHKTIQAEKLQVECQKESSECSNLFSYLSALMKLKARVQDRIYISAAEKLKNDVIIRNLNKTNKALKLKIADATKKLTQEKESFKIIFSEKENIIKKLQEQLDFLDNNGKSEIHKIIIDTENEMKNSNDDHISKLSILNEKNTENKEHYECLLRENLDMENRLRTSRCKVESELLCWINQYDEVVGSKQATLDHVTECYEKEKQEFEELQKKFNEQEKIYIPLMAQKEEEYQKEVLHKMTTFLMEHAARVIQRAWRKILNARAEKKRLKKLASKKKKVKDSSVSAIQI